jgi:hypothetical protein
MCDVMQCGVIYSLLFGHHPPELHFSIIILHTRRERFPRPQVTAPCVLCAIMRNLLYIPTMRPRASIPLFSYIAIAAPAGHKKKPASARHEILGIFDRKFC